MREDLQNTEIVCDLKAKIGGHSIGFLQNILSLLAESNLKKKYVFLLPPVIEAYMPLTKNSNITIIYLKNTLNEKLKKTSILKRRVSEWLLIKKMAIEYAATHVKILDIDEYQHIIGIDKTPFQISGIYFRPHFRIESQNNLLLSKIPRWKKIIMESLLLNNKRIIEVFILNDVNAVNHLNKLYRPVFKYLPDPIFDYPIELNFDIREKYAIPYENKVFLLFGAISERKNVVNIIKGLEILNSQFSQISLLIIGTINKEYNLKLDEYINNVTFQIVTDFRFVSNSEMECIFSQTDIVLLIYKDLYVSSGLLGVAAKHNKISVVSNKGLLAELVEKFELGFLTKPEEPNEIANVLYQITRNYSDYNISGSKFVETHTPKKFVQTLFANELI